MEEIVSEGGTHWRIYLLNRDLLPILSSMSVALKTKGRVYDTYVCSAMLYSSDTWAPRQTELVKTSAK